MTRYKERRARGTPYLASIQRDVTRLESTCRIKLVSRRILPAAFNWVVLSLVVAIGGYVCADTVQSVQLPNSVEQSGGFGGSTLGSVQDAVILTKYSDVIVKGKVTGVRQKRNDGSNGRIKETITIQVQSIFKGSVGRGTIDVVRILTFREAPLSVYVPQVGDTDIFFLRLQKGSYNPVDPVTATLQISGRSVPLPSEPRTALGKVRNEILISLADPDPIIAKSALEQIRRIGTQQCINVLLEIALSGGLEAKAMAYADLLRLGDYSLLSRTIPFVESDAGSEELQYWKSRVAWAIGAIGADRLKEARNAAGSNVVVSCSSKVKIVKAFNRGVLAQLNHAVTSPRLELRRGAVHALRYICDPSSAGFLARALNDPDRQVEYDAMMGLAALEGFPSDLPAPAKSIFNANPAKYVDKWKSWWETTGKQKYTLNR